jgi:AcrR family transcriptional regulator
MNSRTNGRVTAGRSGSARKPGVRELAAQATRDSLLRAATKVFSKHGLEGGSVEQISKAAKSYDRMIYYYFGNKEGLYLAVLEETYRRFNDAESALELDLENPLEALRAVVRFILNYYRKNPEFVALLNTENMHRGKHIGKSLRARELSSPAIGVIERLLRSGATKGVFREDLSARDLYLMIAALGYFYQSNRFTLSAFLGENLEAPEAIAHWEAFATDAVLRTVAFHAPPHVP